MADRDVLPHGACFVFRGGPDVLEVAGAAFGVALPRAACRSAVNGGRAALWLGPDEWLLLAEAAEGDAVEAALTAALAGKPAALVDVSHRQIFFELCGADAAARLNGGCPLDLDEAAFPVGMCTRTVLAKAEIILWRTARDIFRVGVWRSFLAYVQGHLQAAAALR